MTLFQDPMLLLLLLAVPLLALAGRWARARRKRRLEAFAERATWGWLSVSVSRAARRAKAVILLAAFALAVVGAARPTWGARERIVKERGVDIIVAVDVSNSMMAADMEPTRLEQARRVVRRLLSELPGQRIGLVPFAGDAFLQCPLTTDYAIVQEMLAYLGPNIIGEQGTDIGRAIEVSRQAFAEGSTGTKVLVLITDGEDHEGAVDEQAELARGEGVRIFTLGLGTPDGAEVPDLERSQGAVRRILQAPDGTRVYSRLDVETLKLLSERTLGETYVARPGQVLDVRPLADSIKAMRAEEFGEARRVIPEERFQWPLALALALLLAEGLLRERRRAPKLANPKERQP